MFVSYEWSKNKLFEKVKGKKVTKIVLISLF